MHQTASHRGSIAARTSPPLQIGVVTVAILSLGAGAIHLTTLYSVRHAALLLIGAALGLVLYHARFGFTYAFRVFISAGDAHGIRAQMLMLAVATICFVPLLTWGDVGGGARAPLSLSVLIGAVIFSIGMQLGGG